MKRFARFLFHFDGGKTDSRGEIIFDPYDQIRRGPIRASGGFRERPVFGEVNWNPGPRLERRGATRGRRTEVQQETECEGEECCGRRGRERTRPWLAEEGAEIEGGENGMDASELEEALGPEVVAMLRAHADSAVSGLGEGRGDGGSPCEEIEGGDQGSEESRNGELSAHPSPKTGVDGDGDGYF